MKNSIRNLLLVSCLLFAASYDCCVSGINYDKRYKLSPEIDADSCVLMTVYGKRWMRLGFLAFSLGSTFSLAALLMYHRKKQAEGLRHSIFTGY